MNEANRRPKAGEQLKVVLTGGGTAGHVMPHVALLPAMHARNWSLLYIGSENGVEKMIIEEAGLEYRSIATGKLRRYMSWQNFLDVFRVLQGIVQAYMILREWKPDLVVSKGGFVSVPACVAAWMLGIPVISHESDLTPGLANRLTARFAFRLLYTFSTTLSYLPKRKAFHCGLPIRETLMTGNPEQGMVLCGFSSAQDLPVLLLMGGSQGAVALNKVLEESLPQLLTSYRVVHITGKKGKKLIDHPHYKAFAFVKEDMPHLLAMADLIVSRAGANSIFELLQLQKPTLLVPLTLGSRGDQLQNAEYFRKKGWSHVVLEEKLSSNRFIEEVEKLKAGSKTLVEAMRSSKTAQFQSQAIQHTMTAIEEGLKSHKAGLS